MSMYSSVLGRAVAQSALSHRLNGGGEARLFQRCVHNGLARSVLDNTFQGSNKGHQVECLGGLPIYNCPGP